MNLYPLLVPAEMPALESSGVLIISLTPSNHLDTFLNDRLTFLTRVFLSDCLMLVDCGCAGGEGLRPP